MTICTPAAARHTFTRPRDARNLLVPRARRTAVDALLMLAAVAMALSSIATMAAEREFPPPPGPHVNLKPADFAEAKSFTAADRIVMTYYFYWYDVASKSHIIDGDGTDALTTHPASMDDFSYKSVSWHKSQLSDMIAAGIDVVLPVYWGAPSEHKPSAGLHWSFEGLPPLVQAVEELLREGKPAPRIGLFYDTSTLRHNAWGVHADLTTDFGRRWFYATIRDYFSMIPPRHWAMIDGRPIVGLYTAAFAKNHDQGAFDYVREAFARDFAGRTPYIIREISWNVQADNVYAWGGAIRSNVRGIGQLGPGYDHSAVPGRSRLVVPRDGGKHYEEAWLRVLRRAPRIVAIETWNEFHEGTDIAESREYGRQYIELTRKYSDLFKQGWVPPALEGPYSKAASIEVTLGPRNEERGLTQIEHEDGATAPSKAGGRDCRATQPTGRRGQYMYFLIDDSFKTAASFEAAVEVEYFDAGSGQFLLEYDSHDAQATLNGAYTAARPVVKRTGANEWKTAAFPLPRARFANSQNSGADFRLVIVGDALHVGRVVLTRQPASAKSSEKGPTSRGQK